MKQKGDAMGPKTPVPGECSVPSGSKVNHNEATKGTAGGSLDPKRNPSGQ